VNSLHLIAAGFAVAFALTIAAAVSGVMGRTEFYRWCMAVAVGLTALMFAFVTYAAADMIESLKKIGEQFS
jgi:hypothetical protein